MQSGGHGPPHAFRVVFTPDGSIYVVDSASNRVHIFDSTLKPRASFGENGQEIQQVFGEYH